MPSRECSYSLTPNQTSPSNGIPADATLVPEYSQLDNALALQADLLGALPHAVIAVDVGWRIRYMNRAAEDQYGWPLAEARGRPIWEVIDEPSEAARHAEYRVRLALGETLRGGETRVRRRDGRTMWIEGTTTPVHAPNGQLVGYIGMTLDLTARKRAEALAQGQHELLEMIARGACPSEVLARLALFIESQAEGVLVGVYLLDGEGKRLRPGVAPSLPGAFIKALDGLPIGPPCGSCAVAAFHDEQVLVADIRVDPTWADLRELALAYGLRACWSTPIPDATGRMLGTLTLYRHEPGLPSDEELALIDLGTHIAGIALERERNERQRRETENLYRTLVEGTLSVTNYLVQLLPHHPILYISPQIEALLGWSANEFRADPSLWGAHVHPEDLAPLMAGLEEAVARGRPIQAEYRMRRRDGRLIWVRDEAVILPATDMRPALLHGVLLDVTVEHEARANEAHLAAIVESSSDAILSMNLDGYITSWNQGAERIYGYRAEDIIGRHCSMFVLPENHYAIAPVLDMLGRGERIEAHDEQSVRADGRLIDVLVSLSPIVTPSGEVTGISVTARDITASKQAELQLREREAYFRAAAEATNQSFLILRSLRDEDGRVVDFDLTYANRRWRSLHDLSQYQPGTPFSHTLADYLDVPVNAAMYQRWKSVAETGEGFTEETLLWDIETNRLVWQYIQVVPVSDGIAVTLQDIHERKMAQERIRESEARLAAAQRIANLGNWEFDLRTRAAHWSEEVYHICGLPLSGSLDAEQLLALFHPDERARVYQTLRTAVYSLQPIALDLQLVRPTGEVRSVVVHAEVVAGDDGRPIKVVGTLQDITRLKVAETRLRESEARFRIAFDNALMGMAVETPTGQFLRINPALAHMVGYTVDELTQKSFQDITHPDDRQAREALLAEMLAGQRDSYQREQRFLHKDGAVIWGMVSVALVRDDDGQPLYLVALSQDLTERKRAESELKAVLQAQRAANADLQRISHAKSEFISTVSHEFRSALAGIRTFGELIADLDLTPDQMKRYARDIQDEAVRLSRLISEMLDLDRIESGEMGLDVGLVDINELIEAVAHVFEFKGPEHHLRLTLDPTVPLITGDTDKLTIVLTNLIENAIKYSPAGREIGVTSRLEGDVVHVAIQDHGIGIPHSALERIFDRYVRVESQDTRYIMGTGLGLPIAQQFIRLHGGRIWAESTEGVGSIFHFTLPVSLSLDPPLLDDPVDWQTQPSLEDGS